MKNGIMAVVMAATVAALIPVAPGTALAEPIPEGCHSGFYYQNYRTWASCDRGAGYVRAIATCPTSSGSTKVLGPWVVVQPGIDGQSVATCPNHNRKALAHGFDIKKY
ncbi:hypothetical protein [Nonomuraea aurantiaca]|uniref:hypothetical protein n=1 Tax=Nonomuraea aurantiaca TaxID=2878562 RepID=UPI001CD97B28|nr:hypothetical protein [Nonomuraea aurantiaca]MCA2227802.1 hypothetical protein [Nonomuraea aurantiaca]